MDLQSSKRSLSGQFQQVEQQTNNGKHNSTPYTHTLGHTQAAELKSDRLVRCIHKPGTVAEQRARERQVQETLRLAAESDYDELISRLDNSLVTSIASHLEARQAYNIGLKCFEQYRHDLAIPLFRQILNTGEAIESIEPWTHFYLGLCYKNEGRLLEAAQELTESKDKASQSNPELANSQVVFYAQFHLSLILLSLGRNEEASQLLKQLRSLDANKFTTEENRDAELIARTLATIDWLQERSQDLSKTVNWSERHSFAIAIENAKISICGTLLHIKGWIVDPGQQLQELCIIRGTRMWRGNLGHAKYFHRPDLVAIATSSGGSSDLECGLDLPILCLGEERLNYTPGEQAEIFFILSNGQQACLRIILQPIVLSHEAMSICLEVAINKSGMLVSPSALDRTKHAWRQHTSMMTRREYEHYRFGKAKEPTALSILVHLDNRIDSIEYLLNQLTAAAAKRQIPPLSTQMIFILDNASLRDECLALARRCELLYESEFEIVVNPAEIGASASLNRGAKLASADYLLLLNADILPSDSGSIERMLRTIKEHAGVIGILGGCIFQDDQIIQHLYTDWALSHTQGNLFGRIWTRENLVCGIKLNNIEERQGTIREVESVRTGCLMISADLFHALGGMNSDYLAGDFEDIDLCLKLRSTDLCIAVDISAKFISIEPRNDLFKAMPSHQPNRSALINTIFQHRQWCSTIELMKECKI